MTLQELYSQIQGDYDKAMQVLRMEKLLDKDINVNILIIDKTQKHKLKFQLGNKVPNSFEELNAMRQAQAEMIRCIRLPAAVSDNPPDMEQQNVLILCRLVR